MPEWLKSRLIFFFPACLIMGLIFVFMGNGDNAAARKAELDFNYMRETQFDEGSYVKGRVYEVMGEFAYEETYKTTFGIKTSERISSHFYVVPMIGSETPYYVAVEIAHKDIIPKAEKLMEQTWAYHNTGVEPAIWGEFDIVGKVRPLEGELLDYMYEWFMDGDPTATRAEYSQYICPYIIKYHSIESTNDLVIIGLIGAIIGGIGTAVLVILFLKGRNNGAVRATLPTVPYAPPVENAQSAYNPDDDPRFNMPVNPPSADNPETPPKTEEEETTISDRWGD